MEKMRYNGNAYNYTLGYEDKERIRELLLYRKIIKVDVDTFYLDNGIELKIVPNEGCGGCGMGWYDIDEINNCDNAITNVEVCNNGAETVFNIFVYAENKKIKILEVTGDDNGYYGVGYHMQVKIPRELEIKNENTYEDERGL